MTGFPSGLRTEKRTEILHWHIRQAWPHRFGNSGLRWFIRDCVKELRNA